VRPSGTEDTMKIYAESFLSQAHLQRILTEAQTFVRDVLNPGNDARLLAPPPRHEPTVCEAIEVWENEGDPN
jgi:hypothetical protein